MSEHIKTALEIMNLCDGISLNKKNWDEGTLERVCNEKWVSLAWLRRELTRNTKQGHYTNEQQIVVDSILRSLEG